MEKAGPQAAQVYDLFHVPAKYSEVDVVRNQEAKKQAWGDRKLINGSRYLLLRTTRT